MEVIRPSKFATKDFLTSMPDIVITNILDRLPLQDAVRTSILSKNWRFKWTMLSQLVFDDNLFWHLGSEYENDFGRIISRFLLHLQGAITKLVLYIDVQCYSVNVEDVSHWIVFLSRKGIKDLTICNQEGSFLKLPTHIFSCLELKHLKLVECCFDPPTSFHGFPNLLSLELCMVEFESGKFGEFFTRDPVLEILKIEYPYKMFNMGFPEVKLAEIAKLANLKILSLFLCNLDNTCSSSTIFELVGSLPKLQELYLNFSGCKLTEGVIEKRFHTTYPCLKALKLSNIDLGNDIKLSYAFQMIRIFPNLQDLEITPCRWDAAAAPTPEICSHKVVDYNTIGLLQLQSVYFTYLKGSENEVCLIKYLLACSPFLKKIVIGPLLCLESNEKLKFARKLLKLHRASPVVDIDFC